MTQQEINTLIESANIINQVISSCRLVNENNFPLTGKENVAVINSSALILNHVNTLKPDLIEPEKVDVPVNGAK